MINQAFKKILVADDEAEALASLSNILERANYKVISTSKGKEVVDLAMRLKPDLIILDIVMPDMEGSEIASILVRKDSTANIPIIFLTGIISREEEETVESRTGRHYVLAKPATPKELLEMVSKALSTPA
ncbi:MAG: response regulator [Candidatus Omnitrophota bacterium]